MLCSACQLEFEILPGAGLPRRCAHCGSYVLGRYCDLDWIGGGAMGDVYRARQPDMGNRTVAIKLPKADQARIGRRFEREIAASARLKHENIVCAFDRGEESGHSYLVMEFVAGRMLSDVVEAEHPLAPARVARVAAGVARGLVHAMERGIVNRDIKPDNILLATPDDTAKILDYGLARIAELDGDSYRVTRAGTTLGTPGFLAPEQADDPHDVTIAADVYSLGCTLFYALTRRPPFLGINLEDFRRRHAGDPRPSIREVRPDVPAEFEELIHRMMSVDPALRPTPKSACSELDRMLPRLSDARPTLAAPAAPIIDVTCPECGETYHVRSDAQGKRLQCRNKLCRHRFTVTLAGQPDSSAAALLDGIPIVGEAAPAAHPSPPVSRLAPTEFYTGPSVADALSRTHRSEVGPPEVWQAMPVDPIDLAPPVAAPFTAEPYAAEPYAAEPFVAAPYVAEPAELDDTSATSAARHETPPETLQVLPAAAIVDDGAPPVRLDLAGAAPYEAPVAYEGSAPYEAPVADPAADWQAAGLERVSVAAGRSYAASEDTPPTLPMGSIIGEPEDQPARPDKPRRKVTVGTRLFHLAEAAAVLLLVGLGSYVGWTQYQEASKGPETRWKEIQDVFTEKKWSRAKEDLAKYQENYPDSPHVAEIPFFLVMCDAGEGIFSTTGDPAKGLKSMEKIFQDFRDTPTYAAYCADLYQFVGRLIERFVERSGKNHKPQELVNARSAHELLRTVAESMKDAWVPERTEAFLTKIEAADEQDRTVGAQKEVLALLSQARDPEAKVDLDELYAKVEALLSAHPDIRSKNKDIDRQWSAAYQSEADRVRYVPENEADAAAPTPSAPSAGQGQTWVVVWGEPGEQPASAEAPATVLALARGVLYGLEPNGAVRWARRLGLDAYRLPLTVDPTATSPAALIAISPEENSLVSLDALDGGLLWQYRVGGDGSYVSALPTVISTRGGPLAPIKRRGLLPTSRVNDDGSITGDVHVLELALGRRIGRYQVGQPMTVGGAYDPQTGLAYFPADGKRVFALNPAVVDPPKKPAKGAAKPVACESVLFTEHASGSLRSEPAVVGQYLILSESSELEHMNLRAFELGATGFANPKSAPLKQLALAGWSWFPPRTSPDRITLITDQGDLGVFGLNLDNPDEAIYRLVASGPTTRLALGADAVRALAIHADEHLLWVMAGGKLHKLSLDILRQQIKPLPWKDENPEESLLGVPVHEPQMDRAGQVFFLTSMSYDGRRLDATAIRSDTGERLWHRQLGVSLAADPISQGESVMLIDRSGRLLRLTPSTEPPSDMPRIIQPRDDERLPPGADDRPLIVMGPSEGPSHLVASLAEGKQLAVRDLRAGGAWTTVVLPEPLQGRPCLVGDFLAAPCADGLLHRIAYGKEIDNVNEQSFPWARTQPPGPDRAELYPLSDDAVLLVDGGRRVRRLQFLVENLVKHWVLQGTPFELTGDDVLSGPPLVTKDRAILADTGGQVRAIDLKEPALELQSWDLKGRPTGECFIRDGRLLAVLDERRLACVSPDAPAAPQEAQAEPADAAAAPAVAQEAVEAPQEAKEGGPLWTTEPFAGRIVGSPLLAGDVLLVTDESRRVTGIRLSDGKQVWQKRLGVRVGPAATAAPFGKDAKGAPQMMVPLADGTLLVFPIPAVVAAADEDLAEAQR